jgi:hypothetical protein
MKTTIAVCRPIPPRAWTRDRQCRILAGCYETSLGTGRTREVYVPDQVGTIEGWSYRAWEGRRPVEATVYVRVDLG